MQFKSYAIVTRAVEEGAAYGVARAFKHTDDPDKESLIASVTAEVINALCDVFDFDEDSE